ncbi:methionine--tRNA ligase [Natronogracilivirga saccharolytica]|uniref:Methionine--tRNA ligase n=1 Tax=Natronogracilivirga saccharolytica TaxID=2812953 RepID=A0A8J7RMV1_9BACT|nr:methionine--tRNA ligase [Natronogracilivirga saccharolytica]MBP3192948.1 methionine--tRNA ligase [Natronogracilivirga saccharolytica]
MGKRTLVTSALPYANGPIHLGHMAGAYLPADFYVRYKRMRGEDVVFICGSDEHGVPITIAADKEGVTPQEIVDRFHEMNKKTFEEFGITFDYFGRTSSKVHHETSRDFFRKLNEKGVFKKKKEIQFYDERAGMFLPDRYVKGTCPHCGYAEAFGDQCEKCGTSLSPTDLIEPRSMVTDEQPVRKETEHWFLPLGDFQDDLKKWLDSTENWKPNVMGQVKSWLDLGLGDRAVTRDLTWGVPVPLEEAEGKVLYVWFDAPIGYISATKEWAENSGQPDLWKKYWCDEDTDLIHFIGKDNIVFHCIMFPAVLMSYDGYILPKNVPANEFLNLEGKKLSTSRGWAVWLHEYLKDFEPDLLRYVLGIGLPETKDSDFSWKYFQEHINGELADILGNFIFRTLSFTNRYHEGNVPEAGPLSDKDKTMLSDISRLRDEIAGLYETFRFREAIQKSMQLARLGNKYFTEMEPWHLRKNDPERCATVLNVCCQVSAALSVLFDPVIPDASAKLRSYMNIEKAGWADIGEQTIPAGHPIEKGEILFKKIEDDVIDAQWKKLEEQSKESEADEPKLEPLKNTITFEDFGKLDLRVGEIITAEPVPKSNKLIKVIVDIGIEKRTIMAGIAGQVDPDELTGKKVTVVANLKPRKMMGIPSEGMILMAETPDGKLKFLTSDAQNGSIIS